MRLKARVGKAESQIMAEYSQEYDTWLHGLSDDQLTYLMDALLSRLAREGLGPDLHGQSLGELPGEEADEALDQAQEMQARDKPRAGQLHSEAILETVGRYQNWPGIERWRAILIENTKTGPEVNRSRS